MMDDKKRAELERLIEQDNQFHADLRNAAHGSASADVTARAERLAKIEYRYDNPPFVSLSDVRWLVAEVKRLEAQRARVLEALRAGQYVAALRAAEGEGEGE